MISKDEYYMREAIKQAKRAYKLGEVPIGCVIVYEGDKGARSSSRSSEINGISGSVIIGRGYNRRNTDRSTLAHAEITAIRKASKTLGDWRLEDCTIYITLEPCQMCAGAIVQARIPRVVYGASSPKAGCAGSVVNILENPGFNHQVEVVSGVLKSECSELIRKFFMEMRRRNHPEEDG